jgi:peptide/nickel transport system substrate-binding protein
MEVTHKDDRVIEIHFPRPFAAAEYILSTVPVLPRHLMNDPSKKIEDFWNLETSPAEMAGLGPFVIAEHLSGEKTSLKRNPHYWKVDSENRRLPYMEGLEISYVEDRNSKLLRFQSDELDLLDYQLRPEDFLQLEEAGGTAQLVNAGPSSHLTFFWFNLNTGKNSEGRPFVEPVKLAWFSNLEFRRAIDSAISRDAIVENVFLGQANPTRTLVPGSIPFWHLESSGKTGSDMKTARDHLKGSGFSWLEEGGREQLVDPLGNPVEFTILTRSDDVWGRIAALLQYDLEALGVRVRIQQEELRSLGSRLMRSRDYDAALMAFEIPFEPAEHAAILLSGGPMHCWNPFQSSPQTAWEKRIDELMNQQTTSLDLETRRLLYLEVQQIMMDEIPILPLVNRNVLVAAQARVRNLRPANLFPNALWNVWELWLAPSDLR